METEYPGSAKIAESAVLFLSIAGLLAAASHGLGLTWDEGIYFNFTDGVLAWLKRGAHWNPEALTRAWGYSYWNPHPPFMKILSAIFVPVFLPLMGFPVGYRVGHFVFTAAGLTVVYRLLSARFGRGRSLMALCFVLLQPRVFGEWLIGTTDGPMALCWLLLPLIAWKISEREPSRRTSWRCAFFLFFGFAAATKVTGFLILFPAAAFFLWRRQFKELMWLAVCGVYGLFFVLLVSPDRWRAPLSCVRDYLIYPFMRKQIPITSFYLGNHYITSPPWHYFDFMSGVTFPVILAVLAPMSFFAWRRHRNLMASVLAAVLFWLSIGHWPSTPKHDGVRQFIGLFPLLGLLSWMGWLRALDFCREKLSGAKQFAARAAVVVLPLVALAIPLIRTHPFELSYYNAFIGGLPGAEKRGMEMTYYFETIQPSFLKAVNQTLPSGTSLSLVPYWPDLLESYQENGLLRDDIAVSWEDKPRTGYVLVCRRRSVIDDAAYLKAPALKEVTHDGVSLTKLVRIK